VSFETINFDIVILIITFFSLLFGFYYGFSRRVKNIISFIIPLVAMHLFFDKIILAIEKNELVMSRWRGFISWLGRNFSVPYYYNFYLVIIVAIVIYLALFIIIKLNISAFKGEPIKAVLHKEKMSSRLIATGLSFISAYFINLLVLFLSVNVFLINDSKPVTNLLVDTSKKITYIGEYIEVKYALEEYQRLEDEFDLINGNELFEIYSDLLELNKKGNKDINKFAKTLEKDIEEYKPLELFEKFIEYYENLYNEKDKFHYSHVIKKIKEFDLISKSMANELGLVYNKYDLDEYHKQINESKENNLDGFVRALKVALNEEDFPKICNFINEYEKNPNDYLGGNLVYSIVVKRFPNLENIEKISEKNIFVRTYISDGLINNNFRGQNFLQND